VASPLKNTEQLIVCIPLYCKYCELFSIVNRGLSIDCDTKMAVLLSPSCNIHTWVSTLHFPFMDFDSVNKSTLICLCAGMC